MRFAILGAGHGAAVYLPALRQLGHEPVLLACRSRKPELDLEQTADWRAAMARPDIEAVVIAFPPPLQREAVLAAAALAKPFICEKPAGMTPQDADEMLAAAQKAGLAHAVGYQFRYEPAFAEIKRQIESGKIGQVERMEVDWCVGGEQSRGRPWSWRNDAILGGGVMLNFATHTLDYLRWFCGDAAMTGRASQILVKQRMHENAMRDVTAPDACDFLLRFESSAVASIRITNTALSPLGHRVIVRGSSGTLELWHRPPFRNTDMTFTISHSGGQSVRSGEEMGTAAEFADSRTGPTCALIEDFVSAVSGTPRSRMPTLRDAVAIQRLLA